MVKQGLEQRMNSFELDYQITSYESISLFRTNVSAAASWLDGPLNEKKLTFSEITVMSQYWFTRQA